jgi:uncharacterized protein (UPF0332 family)
MDDGIVDLSKYRLEQAEQCIRSARLLVEANDYKGAANRSYYCIFHCMRAVLATDHIDFSKHSGVSAYFRKMYIKTGIFDDEYSDIIREAFDYRSDSDYDDFYVITKEEVLEQLVNAQKFYDAINKFLERKFEKNNQ